MNAIWHTDVVIIGAGLAGLTAAWHLRDRGVTVLSSPQPDGASYLARGGIAVAIGEDDSPEVHVQDTVRAGAGLVDQSIADILVREGLERMIDLFELSIPFDRDPEGLLMLGREALHSRHRIVHAIGDETGRAVTHAVRNELDSGTNHSVSFIHGRALELITHKGQVRGVLYATAAGEVEAILAPAVVLATGGVGGLYRYTTNPARAVGEGITLAARAGAALVDLEFVQFHPTALALPHGLPLPLLSEAIRGQGATLIDATGTAVMAHHPEGDLAGRDVVTREIWKRVKDDVAVYLDVRNIENFSALFPAAARACKDAGIDPVTEPIPVTPAAHYHMGGIATDTNGHTSICGLWAIGEVASTGAHGANRLASNSLLEALVFGARAGRDIQRRRRTPHILPLEEAAHLQDSWARGLSRAVDPAPVLQEIRRIMWQYAGIERCETRLHAACLELDALSERVLRHDPARLSLEAARAIVRAARRRTESRGAHYRTDFPNLDPVQARRFFVHGLQRRTTHFST